MTSTTTVPAPDNAFPYDPGGFWDEMFARPGEVREVYRPLAREPFVPQPYHSSHSGTFSATRVRDVLSLPAPILSARAHAVDPRDPHVVALDRDSHTTSGTETVGLILPFETTRAMVEPGSAVFGE